MEWSQILERQKNLLFAHNIVYSMEWSVEVEYSMEWSLGAELLSGVKFWRGIFFITKFCRFNLDTMCVCVRACVHARVCVAKFM